MIFFDDEIDGGTVEFPVVAPPVVLTEIQQINQDLADRINAEVRADPQSPLRGKYLGIANGKVVATADTLTEVCDALNFVEPDYSRTFCLEAGQDFEEEVWVGEIT